MSPQPNVRRARRKSSEPAGGSVRGESMDSSQSTDELPSTRLLTSETRREMIREAAYWRAERRGFSPGFELEDWLAAEAEIDALLAQSSG